MEGTSSIKVLNGWDILVSFGKVNARVTLYASMIHVQDVLLEMIEIKSI